MAMEKKYIIVINIGSESKKYAFYSGDKQIFFAHFEKENKQHIVRIESEVDKKHFNITGNDYKDAFGIALEQALTFGISIDKHNVTGIGIRIVAPGTFFTEHRMINDMYLKKLKDAQKIAPLHINQTLVEIDYFRKFFPEIAIFGISDSELHKDLPCRARLYAIPYGDAKRLDIYRFGYHGISVQSIIRELEDSDRVERRIIVCHLGGGSSITALLDGKSIDTSMGFTPDEGVPMATRVGTIDVAAVEYLTKNLNHDKALDYFSLKSGLLGVSGQSSDIRQLLEFEANGDRKSQDALALYVYHIQKYIGAFSAALGGIDSIIFTGTVGQRSAIVRSRILSGFEWLGVNIDKNKNNNLIDEVREIMVDSSRVKLLIIPTREMNEIAFLTSKLINNQ